MNNESDTHEIDELKALLGIQKNKYYLRNVIFVARGVHILPSKMEYTKIIFAALAKILDKNNVGIWASETKMRPNEFGNHMEDVMKYSLENLEDYPGISVIHYSKGYPDLAIQRNGKTLFYLEIKTLNQNSMNSSFRSFYFSLDENAHIDTDAPHYLVGFKTDGSNNLTGDYEVLDLYNMRVNLKKEFNTSNKEMYKEEYSLSDNE